jgi:GxxExxY protein
MEVHKTLGAGLLESVYQTCLAREFALQGITFEQEKVVPGEYKGTRLESGLRMDFVMAEKVVVELKALERLLPIHEAQLLAYLKLSGYQVGLLINFNVLLLKRGIVRRVV